MRKTNVEIEQEVLLVRKENNYLEWTGIELPIRLSP